MKTRQAENIKIVNESLNEVLKLINKQTEEFIKEPNYLNKSKLNWNLRTLITLIEESLININE